MMLMEQMRRSDSPVQDSESPETLMGHFKENPCGKNERLFSPMADPADILGNDNHGCHTRYVDFLKSKSWKS